LDESTRRRIEAIQTQSEARWREAEAECERLRESLRRAEREALREQQALLTMHSTAYDSAAMSPSSGTPERESPDWLVARQKSNDLRGQYPVASKSGVEERWARVYETLHKLNSELTASS
jgi:predicted phage gp36 major capsid-like protein